MREQDAALLVAFLSWMDAHHMEIGYYGDARSYYSRVVDEFMLYQAAHRPALPPATVPAQALVAGQYRCVCCGKRFARTYIETPYCAACDGLLRTMEG